MFTCFSLHLFGSFSPSWLLLSLSYLIMTTAGPSVWDLLAHHVCPSIQIPMREKENLTGPKPLCKLQHTSHVLQPACLLVAPGSGVLQVVRTQRLAGPLRCKRKRGVWPAALSADHGGGFPPEWVKEDYTIHILLHLTSPG